MIDETPNTVNSLRLFPYDPRFTPASAPLAGVFDPPTFSICVNAEWLSHLDGVIERLAWRDAWLGVPEDQQRAVDETVKLLGALAGAISCGEETSMFQLRQNPTNPCILEQSTDGGLSWSPAFDYSLCRSSSGLDISLGLTIVNNDTTIYNDNPAVFEPELSDADDFTNTAICYALEVVIRSALSGILSRLESENNQAIILQSVFSAIAVVGAFTFGPIGAGIATAIGVSIGLIASSIMDELEESEVEEALNSNVAISELVCCAYETLFGFRPTPALFDDVLDGCTELGPVASNVAPALAEVFDYFDTFVQFLRVAGQAYTYAENGLLGNSCDNCGDEWCYQWLNGEGFSPAWTINEWNGGLAVYDPVNDRINGFKPDIANFGAFVDIEIAVNAIVTYIDLDIQWSSTRNSPSDFVELSVNGAVVDSASISGTATTQVNHFVPEGFFCTSVRFRGFAAVNNAGDAGFMRVNQMFMQGFGENAFGADNCEPV